MISTGYYNAQTAPRRTASVTSAEPKGGGMMQTFSSGDMIDKGAVLAHLWNAGKTGVQGGRAVNPAFGALFKAFKNLNGNGIFNGFKGIIGSTLPFLGRSALFEGAISVVANGYKMATGRIGVGEFSGRIVADTMTGLAGGGGAALAGAVCLAVIPFGGMMATILGAVAGIAGYSMAASMFRSSNIYRKVVGTVRGAMGG